MKISREWIFVIIWSAFVVLLANIPYIYGYVIAPQGKMFMGDARTFIDTNTYLAWMRQAADGQVLFKDMYTTEPHARMFFHPLFLLLGNISRFTTLSLVTVHGISRVLFGFFLLLLIYEFVSYFIEGSFERSLTFILISLSGGFGLLNLWPSVSAIPESWFLTGWIEGNTFLSIYALPLFSASLLMLIATFLFMLRAFEEGRAIYSVWAGVLCLFLVFTHFFDALIVYPVLIGYIAVKYFVLSDTEKLKSDIRLFLIMFIISCGAGFYNFLVSLIDPVFGEHAWKGAITLSPPFIWYLGGLGFIAILASIGVFNALFDEGKSEKLFLRRMFLVVWALMVPLLIYVPISFQRRLVEGVHVPATILAAIGFFYLVKRFNLNARTLAAALIIFTLPNSLYVMHKDMSYLKENSQGRSMAGFIDKDIVDAMDWLKENTLRTDVIFCDYETGNYVPAESGNVVFIGHSPQTINFDMKWAATKEFFNGTTSDEKRRAILAASGALYVFYGWKEASIGDFNPASANYLTAVYRNGVVTIYKVKL